MGDGVGINDMYPMDVDRALSAIERIKPYVTKFWTGGNEPRDLLLNGEVDMAAIWVSRISNYYQTLGSVDDSTIDFTWNQHLTAQDIIAIPKGAPDLEAAQYYINFRLRPEVQGLMLNTGTSGPSNALAQPYIQKDRQIWNPLSDQNEPLGHFRDPEQWIGKLSDIDARVTELLGV